MIVVTIGADRIEPSRHRTDRSGQYRATFVPIGAQSILCVKPAEGQAIYTGLPGDPRRIGKNEEKGHRHAHAGCRRIPQGRSPVAHSGSARLELPRPIRRRPLPVRLISVTVALPRSCVSRIGVACAPRHSSGRGTPVCAHRRVRRCQPVRTAVRQGFTLRKRSSFGDILSAGGDILESGWSSHRGTLRNPSGPAPLAHGIALAHSTQCST